jgi:Cu-Zn family superoxide dismutase
MLKKSIAMFALFCSPLAFATTVTINETHSGTATGKLMGTVEITESKYGLMLTPHLTGLKAGIHGFHVHVKPDCANNGDAAGGHFDPSNTGKHLGPFDDKGHLGDLPALYVSGDGTATLPVVAPRLKLSDVKDHALMVHNGADNYSDQPQPLGGGDGRMLCGVIR